MRARSSVVEGSSSSGRDGGGEREGEEVERREMVAVETEERVDGAGERDGEREGEGGASTARTRAKGFLRGEARVAARGEDVDALGGERSVVEARFRGEARVGAGAGGGEDEVDAELAGARVVRREEALAGELVGVE